MDIEKWLSAFMQFLVLLPSSLSCYFAVKNQMKYTPLKTAIICMAVLLPYSFVATWLCVTLRININAIFTPSLCFFFFLYRHTVTSNLSVCLAIYVGVCAVQTFPAQFAYAFDAYLHPMSGAANFSVEAAIFQFVLSCIVVAAFAWPACQRFSWAVDHLDLPKVWSFTVPLSFIFLIFNILAVPQSYSTIRTGRLYYLFPLIECCIMVLLISVYVLFYNGARLILERAELREHSQLLEMQAYQYKALQEHMQQTARLRHDFRHSVRLLISLAEKGDINSIQKYLAEYDTRLDDTIVINYCENAAFNALFGYYHEIAVSAGIDTDWNIKIQEPLNISELDMASLLGNLMENAIAGCLTVPENARYFCLTTEVRHGNRLYIVSTNSFDGQAHKIQDRYYSTKHSGKGTGLDSINAIAGKYGGSTHISNSDQEFFVDIVLKI